MVGGIHTQGTCIHPQNDTYQIVYGKQYITNNLE